MNLTAWLDVAIGLGVVYLGASLFVTIIGEYVSQWLNLRGRALWDAVRQLISDDTVRTKLAKSAALAPFFGTTSKREDSPSYVDPVVMARVLLGRGPVDLSKLPLGVQEAIGLVRSEAGQAVKTVSHWIDASLTMLAEKYKRWIRWVTLVTGVVVAVGLNLDTVALVNHLYRDKEARDAIVAVAVDVAAKTEKSNFTRCLGLAPEQRGGDPNCVAFNGLVDTVQGRNASLGGLPVGWNAIISGAAADGTLWSGRWVLAWASRLLGWLLTALALSLGAPFWFDLLCRLINVRNGMRRPEINPDSIPETREEKPQP